jgi:hypothetical protein
VAWCDAHHLRHWLHGGATDLRNLLWLCRGHHHAVHEGGWQLHGHPTAPSPPPHPTDDDPPPHERRAGSRVNDGDLGGRWTTRFSRIRHGAGPRWTLDL